MKGAYSSSWSTLYVSPFRTHRVYDTSEYVVLKHAYCSLGELQLVLSQRRRTSNHGTLQTTTTSTCQHQLQRLAGSDLG